MACSPTLLELLCQLHGDADRVKREGRLVRTSSGTKQRARSRRASHDSVGAAVEPHRLGFDRSTPHLADELDY